MIRPQLAMLLAAVVLVAACGTSGPTGVATGQPASAPASPTGSAPPESMQPGGSASDEPGATASEQPSASQSPASQPPTESATPDESPNGSPDAGASGVPSTADACTGTEVHKEFFVNVAIAVDWPVLCGVLPAGWFLSAGQYRLANGGQMVVTYKGSGGATVGLSEGAFCQDGTGCVPSGADVGDAALGSMSGTLVALDDGGYAIVVDRGAALSWLLVTSGLDQATTVALGAALYEVAG